jgi:3-phenylpropionate/trans-cinnamate dioxygenase ferredoxin reductase subunit
MAMYSAAVRDGVVIVGGGVAGASCAVALRERGFDGAITVISAEDSLPYDRTQLSKALFGDKVLSPERLVLHTAEEYDALDIGLELGVAARGIEPRLREVRLADGRLVPYGSVVICTGGRARLPERLRAPGVLTLRNLHDSALLTAALSPGSRLIVVGGGFLGAEVAVTAASRGVDVTMLEQQDAPLAAAVGLEVGQRIAALQRDASVDLRTAALVSRVERRGSAFHVTLYDGTFVRGDVLLVAVGMTPATGWMSVSSVPEADGIVTGPTCETQIPRVFAAGDCARWWHPRYNASIRVEHWDTAQRHGEAAAAAVLGSTAPFAPVPFFWSYQHKQRFHWVGYAPIWDTVEIDDGDRPNEFIARYRVSGVVSAVLTANMPAAAAAARREFESKVALAGSSQ